MRRITLILAAAAALLTTGLAGAAATPVTLTIDDARPTVGNAVLLTARTKLAPGARLLIEGRRAAKKFKVIECRKSPCIGTWSGAAGAVGFQASAVVRKGRVVTTLARSKLVYVTWRQPLSPPPPPPPPPAPPPPPPGPTAPTGKYCGFTDQGISICFDIAGNALTSLRTESNVQCTTSDGRQGTTRWTLTINTRVPLSHELAFTYSYKGPIGTSSSSIQNLTTDYSVTGTVDTAGNATGTIALRSMAWDSGGVHFECQSAPYGWRARLGA